MQEVVEINIEHLNSKSEEVNPNAMEVDEIGCIDNAEEKKEHEVEQVPWAFGGGSDKPPVVEDI